MGLFIYIIANCTDHLGSRCWRGYNVGVVCEPHTCIKLFPWFNIPIAISGKFQTKWIFLGTNRFSSMDASMISLCAVYGSFIIAPWYIMTWWSEHCLGIAVYGLSRALIASPNTTTINMYIIYILLQSPSSHASIAHQSISPYTFSSADHKSSPFHCNLPLINRPHPPL